MSLRFRIGRVISWFTEVVPREALSPQAFVSVVPRPLSPVRLRLGSSSRA